MRAAGYAGRSLMSERTTRDRLVTASIELEITAEGAVLPGVLRLPPASDMVVIFAHGSGSGRLSPRNAAVARALQGDRLATLLFDLLTPREAADRRNVFDIELLAGRLLAAVGVVRDRAEAGGLRVGLFGASTGAAAAITAAAADRRIAALVSRGGRPDLAGPALEAIEAPTLLIVGELDRDVLALNRQSMARMPKAEVRLDIVPGATHLFEEAGALERVAALASDWFRAHV
jgi:putative phosphoribosyl transferase